MLQRTILIFIGILAMAMGAVLLAGAPTRSIDTPDMIAANGWQPKKRETCKTDTVLYQKMAEMLAQQRAPKIQQIETKVVKVLPANAPVIAIVIDDVGVDYKRSARTINNLPPDVTLAFLPYANKIKQQVNAAKLKGHEIFVHMPMEPSSDTIDPGPNYLGVHQDLVEVRERVKANLDAFDGYVGVNNHMGSKFTKDALRLEIVMDELKKRGVMFLDSVTSPKTVAEDVARRSGLRATHRDVFLDHVEDTAHVWAALRQVEKKALKTGSALAIGHPKDVTLDALEEWIPTLHEKGFRLVTVTDITARRSKKNVALNHSNVE